MTLVDMNGIFHALARRLRLLRGSASEDAPPERPASFYDEVYQRSGEYALPYVRSRYYFMWTVIVDRIRRDGHRSVLEIGCGTGQLAEFLLDQGISKYTGFDFSEAAIAAAKSKRLPRAEFLVADARESDTFDRCDCDVVICTEVLEHIEDDLLVLSRIRDATRCILSVPDFPWRAHVRHFESETQVTDRYGHLFRRLDVTAFRRPSSSGGRYFLLDGIRVGAQVSSG